jgi:hypothetical protein
MRHHLTLGDAVFIPVRHILHRAHFKLGIHRTTFIIRKDSIGLKTQNECQWKTAFADGSPWTLECYRIDGRSAASNFKRQQFFRAAYAIRASAAPRTSQLKKTERSFPFFILIICRSTVRRYSSVCLAQTDKTLASPFCASLSRQVRGSKQ